MTKGIDDGRDNLLALSTSFLAGSSQAGFVTALMHTWKLVTWRLHAASGEAAHHTLSVLLGLMGSFSFLFQWQHWALNSEPLAC
jgi:hypothetical protein